MRNLAILIYTFGFMNPGHASTHVYTLYNNSQKSGYHLFVDNEDRNVPELRIYGTNCKEWCLDLNPVEIPTMSEHQALKSSLNNRIDFVEKKLLESRSKTIETILKSGELKELIKQILAESSQQ